MVSDLSSMKISSLKCKYNNYVFDAIQFDCKLYSASIDLFDWI